MELVIPNRKIILACSGGKDSMALAHYLLKNGYNFIIAHFDHQIRSESANEAKFINNFAKEHSIKFELGSKNIPRLSIGKNLEATARKYRYEFLESTRKKHQADLILTAHHQADQIETIMLNWCRGAGLKGLCGMQTHDNYRKIFRPMLNTKLEEIKNYISENSIEHINDSSNLDVKFTRNKIRLHILPKLKLELPDYETVILDLSKIAIKTYSNLAVSALEIGPLVNLINKKQISFSRKEFRNMEPLLRIQLLYILFRQLSLPITSYYLSKAQEIIIQQHSNKILDLKNAYLKTHTRYFTISS